MALFRRRSASNAAPDELTDEVVEELTEAAETGAEPGDDAPAPDATDAGYDRSAGPFDESEAELADQELPRLDLGSLRIPGLPGVQVQVEVDQNSQEVRAVTAIAGDGAVQLQALAAPRSEGLWEELRAEMLAGLTSAQGATVAGDTGAFGPELRAVVPARSPEGKQVMQPLRFTGVDGPRWFLRAVFMGRAAVQPDPEDVLHTLVHQTIVVRGVDARAPRDPLPLRLPEQPPTGMSADPDDPEAEVELEVEGVDAVEESEQGVPNRYTDLDPFERGPEITEIR